MPLILLEYNEYMGYFLHKIFWLFFKPIRTLYRFFARPSGTAVKVLLVHNNSFLLVRPTYGHRNWTIPGGAVEKGESNEDAAKREIFEELKIGLKDVKLFGQYTATVDYKLDTVFCFFAEVSKKDFQVDGVEIKEAKWFEKRDLPKERVPRVDKILALYTPR